MAKDIPSSRIRSKILFAIALKQSGIFWSAIAQENCWSSTQKEVVLKIVLFNPRTAFQGPFGPQAMLTVDIFVIGLIYLLFIFVILYNTDSFWNVTWVAK